MRTPTLMVAALVLAAGLAGCAARGNDDPFAYMRKPLYAGSFDLSKTIDEPKTDTFWVRDGSIAKVKIQVWVNQTAGDARVIVHDPSGNVALDTTSSTTGSFALNLGAWTVTVEGTEGAAGTVGVLATRG